jgi:hypothetical protein
LLGLFVVVQCLIYLALVAVNSPSNTYLAAVSDKSHLLATAPSPRIVLVGDSGLAFGIDSGLIESRLDGRYHVVNMGLHGGLGLEFELGQALDGVRQGDVVVISPAYDSLWQSTPSAHTLWSALLDQPGAWAYLPASEKWWLLKQVVLNDEPLQVTHDIAVITYNRLEAATVQRLKAAARRALGLKPNPAYQSAYVRSGFNKYGDQTSAWNAPSVYDPEADTSSPTPFPTAQVEESVVVLRDFISACQSKGASVLYAYPAVPEPWYRRNATKIYRTAGILESKLPIPFINDPADAVYAPSDFFDMRYHLRGSAVKRRTLDLVRDLQIHLPAP